MAGRNVIPSTETSWPGALRGALGKKGPETTCSNSYTQQAQHYSDTGGSHGVSAVPIAQQGV